ncbi:hypothetical protein [Streptomyces sp. NPDC001020]
MEDAVDGVSGYARRGLATALRSLFRVPAASAHPETTVTSLQPGPAATAVTAAVGP